MYSENKVLVFEKKVVKLGCWCGLAHLVACLIRLALKSVARLNLNLLPFFLHVIPNSQPVSCSIHFPVLFE